MSLADIDLIHVHTVLEPSVCLYVSEDLPKISACGPGRRDSTSKKMWAITCFINLDVIPAHVSLSHLSILCECPILETVTPFPLQAILHILVFIPKLDSDLVVCKSEELLSQAIITLLLPLLGEELLDGGSSDDEGGPITPDGFRCIGL